MGSPTMRRGAAWGPVAVTVAASALLTGAEPAPLTPMPPFPVPPVERGSMPPYFARLTITGDPRMAGEFESCMDPASAARSAEARAKARPADAPPPMTGCTYSREVQPGGSIHTEISCDRTKGAMASFRVIGDGTPNDLRMHMERYAAAAGTTKTTVTDSHMVRLGACPADLEPGQMRRAGGPIVESSEASRLLEVARGTPG